MPRQTEFTLDFMPGFTPGSRKNRIISGIASKIQEKTRTFFKIVIVMVVVMVKRGSGSILGQLSFHAGQDWVQAQSLHCLVSLGSCFFFAFGRGRAASEGIAPGVPRPIDSVVGHGVEAYSRARHTMRHMQQARIAPQEQVCASAQAGHVEQPVRPEHRMTLSWGYGLDKTLTRGRLRLEAQKIKMTRFQLRLGQDRSNESYIVV